MTIISASKTLFYKLQELNFIVIDKQCNVLTNSLNGNSKQFACIVVLELIFLYIARDFYKVTF